MVNVWLAQVSSLKSKTSVLWLGFVSIQFLIDVFGWQRRGDIIIPISWFSLYVNI